MHGIIFFDILKVVLDTILNYKFFFFITFFNSERDKFLVSVIFSSNTLSKFSHYSLFAMLVFWIGPPLWHICSEEACSLIWFSWDTNQSTGRGYRWPFSLCREWIWWHGFFWYTHRYHKIGNLSFILGTIYFISVLFILYTKILFSFGQCCTLVMCCQQ